MSRIEYQVLQVETQGDQLVAMVKNTVFDRKDKQIATHEVKYKCNGSEMLIDMQSTLPQQNATMQLTAQEAYLNFPNSMQVGNPAA
ncbi:MAG: hypothetical protein QM669_14275 [Siphonobacter sp.]